MTRIFRMLRGSDQSDALGLYAFGKIPAFAEYADGLGRTNRRLKLVRSTLYARGIHEAIGRGLWELVPDEHRSPYGHHFAWRQGRHRRWVIGVIEQCRDAKGRPEIPLIVTGGPVPGSDPALVERIADALSALAGGLLNATDLDLARELVDSAWPGFEALVSIGTAARHGRDDRSARVGAVFEVIAQAYGRERAGAVAQELWVRLSGGFRPPFGKGVQGWGDSARDRLRLPKPPGVTPGAWIARWVGALDAFLDDGADAWFFSSVNTSDLLLGPIDCEDLVFLQRSGGIPVVGQTDSPLESSCVVWAGSAVR